MSTVVSKQSVPLPSVRIPGGQGIEVIILLVSYLDGVDN